RDEEVRGDGGGGSCQGDTDDTALVAEDEDHQDAIHQAQSHTDESLGWIATETIENGSVRAHGEAKGQVAGEHEQEPARFGEQFGGYSQGTETEVGEQCAEAPYRKARSQEQTERGVEEPVETGLILAGFEFGDVADHGGA